MIRFDVRLLSRLSRVLFGSPECEVDQAYADHARDDRTRGGQRFHGFGTLDAENTSRELGDFAVRCGETPVHDVEKHHDRRDAQERPEDSHLDR